MEPSHDDAIDLPAFHRGLRRATEQRVPAPPPRWRSVIPLQGPHGIIGFMPLGVIDPATHRVTLEVIFAFSETDTTVVPLSIDRNELECQARLADPAHAVASLRGWVVGQARQQLATEQPGGRTKQQPLRAAIYWVYAHPARREPFLR